MGRGKILKSGQGQNLESAGTGSDHVREKDGLWAVLLWLNILAATGKSVAEIAEDHWRKYGRNYYARHDYEGLDTEVAQGMMSDLEGALSDLPGRQFGSLTISAADQFDYTDPVDGSVSRNQGIRIFFESGARIVFRLSGTGTEGATLRIYLERYEPPKGELDADVEPMLAELAAAASELTDLVARTGRKRPDVIT